MEEPYLLDTQKQLYIPGKDFIDEIQTSFRYSPNSSKIVIFKGGVKSRKNLQYYNDLSKELKSTVVIDETFAGVDLIPGLKTNLYEHQKRTIYAMLALEKTKELKVTTDQNTGEIHINFNAYLLSDPVGSGKTFSILGLILLNPSPRPVKDRSVITSFDKYISCYVKVQYKKYVRQNLIFVNPSVLKQWQRTIEEFTSLKVYVVSDVRMLRSFFALFDENSIDSIDNYDIILVKNNIVTVEIDISAALVGRSRNEYNDETDEVTFPAGSVIYTLIAQMQNVIWNRCIVDDFDSSKIPHYSIMPPALMTIFISSTFDFSSFAKATQTDTPHIMTKTLLDKFRHSLPKIQDIMCNINWYKSVNVRNSTDYIKNSIVMPKPKFHIVTIANPANRVLNAMNLFSGDNVSSVIEMLNSDAIGEAAEKLNIKVNTVAGVFRALLGNKYSSYLYAGDVCSFIEHCKEIADERKIYDVEDRTIERYGKKELLKFKEIEYDQPHIDKLLDETFEEYTKQKKALGLEIQRVKDNLRHGECAICEENITEESQYIIVSGCCNIVCCAKCGFEAHGLKDRYNQLVKGRCAGCRAEISCKSLIVISDEINLDDIYQENIEEYDEEEKEVPQSEEDLKLSAQDTKGCLVVNILKNKKINADKRAEVVIPAMMSGEDVMKEPSVRKMLIFSNYDSGLTAIIKDLEAYKIQYWKLEGTYKEIDYICELFRKFEGSCVLVINSLKHCSGLNLQNATDLVFFHHIKNTEIEGQVVGRGHRLGRTSPLNVWYLTYDNELNHLLETRQVRYLSKEEIDLEEEILKSK